MLFRLYDSQFFTMSDGGEFVTLVPGKPLGVETGDLLEVVCGGSLLFDGTVSHVSENELGTQIVQAVITSVASGGDPSCFYVPRAVCEIEGVKKSLSDFDWSETLKRLGLKKTT